MKLDIGCIINSEQSPSLIDDAHTSYLDQKLQSLSSSMTSQQRSTELSGVFCLDLSQTLAAPPSLVDHIGDADVTSPARIMKQSFMATFMTVVSGDVCEIVS